MAGITIDGVSKIFGKTPALKEISLDVRDGEAHHTLLQKPAEKFQHGSIADVLGQSG